ncbi:MAG TPA: amidohydrolase family protein [Polyangiaceae bacterium]
MRPLPPSALVLFPLTFAACAEAPPPPPTPPAAPAPPAAPPAPLPAAAAPDVTIQYEILFGDRLAGHSKLVRHGDGSYDEDFEFTDRGRGPKLHTRTELADGLIPTRIEVAGHDYLHREVHELATCQADHCTWKNEIDPGEGPRGFYVGLNSGAPSEVFLRAARAASDGLALLPGGKARVRSVAETDVQRGSETRHVVAWELSGFGLYPNISWYDADGSWFGDVGDASSVIREGWSAVAPKLLAIQKPLGAARREKIAAEVAHRPSMGLAVVHARLFDPARRKTIDDATIVIESGRVKSVTPKGTAPKGYEVLDAQGKTVLPGLWDMHVHNDDDAGLLEIAEGVTTVRDMGNEMPGSLARQARWEEGKELGPHLILAGLVDGPGKFQAPDGLYASTPEEATKAVDTYAAKGYAQIKMYSSLKPELVPVVAKEAHAKGLRVSGHVPAGMIAEDAVNAGYDELQHVNFLALDLIGDRKTETQTPVRLTLPAEHAADIDLDGPKAKQLIDLLVKKHTVIDPTLNIFEDQFTVRPDHPSQVLSPILSRLPPQVQRGAYQGALPVPEGKDAAFHESWKRFEQLVKRLWDRHVTIVAGTDNFPGLALHRELEIYSEAGIPNADVLALATLGAAQVMKRDKTSGSIAPGKNADLIVVDGDPLTKMRDIRNVVTVVKGGTVIDAKAAQAALSIAPK